MTMVCHSFSLLLNSVTPKKKNTRWLWPWVYICRSSLLWNRSELKLFFEILQEMIFFLKAGFEQQPSRLCQVLLRKAFSCRNKGVLFSFPAWQMLNSITLLSAVLGPFSQLKSLAWKPLTHWNMKCYRSSHFRFLSQWCCLQPPCWSLLGKSPPFFPCLLWHPGTDPIILGFHRGICINSSARSRSVPSAISDGNCLLF